MTSSGILRQPCRWQNKFDITDNTKHHSHPGEPCFFNSEYSIQLPISPPQRPLTTFQKLPAVRRDHPHEQQVTILCEPSSQVYLSRPMTKSLLTASSYSSPPGLNFPLSALLLLET